MKLVLAKEFINRVRTAHVFDFSLLLSDNKQMQKIGINRNVHTFCLYKNL